MTQNILRSVEWPIDWETFHIRENCHTPLPDFIFQQIFSPCSVPKTAKIESSFRLFDAPNSHKTENWKPREFIKGELNADTTFSWDFVPSASVEPSLIRVWCDDWNRKCHNEMSNENGITFRFGNVLSHRKIYSPCLREV